MIQIPKVPRRTSAAAPAAGAGAERHFPCEACGADLTFAPGQEQLVCAHCGHAQAIPGAIGRGQSGLAELPLDQGLRDDLPAADTEETRTLRCPNCGAEIGLSGAEHATVCPFCTTPVVADTGAQRRIKPQGVLPFVLNEDQAREALTRWLGSLWFAPSGIAQYARKGRRMTGVYAPFWTFDASTRTRYDGQRGDVYYETRTVEVMVDGRPQMRTEQVERIRWSAVSGAVARDFDDVLVYAAHSLAPGHVAGLGPWDLSALREYRADYLAGFSAEGYTLDLAEGHKQATDDMIAVIRTDIRRDIGGDRQQIDAMDPRFDDETFKHILLPIWTAAYRFQGRAFTFVVNAQTGQVQGDRPWSPWKIAAAVAAGLIVAGVLYYMNGNR